MYECVCVYVYIYTYAYYVCVYVAVHIYSLLTRTLCMPTIDNNAHSLIPGPQQVYMI